MNPTILTTIRDAERVIDNWTENYLEQPTPAQRAQVARALVDAVGGYGQPINWEIRGFDIDAELRRAGY